MSLLKGIKTANQKRKSAKLFVQRYAGISSKQHNQLIKRFEELPLKFESDQNPMKTVAHIRYYNPLDPSLEIYLIEQDNSVDQKRAYALIFSNNNMNFTYIDLELIIRKNFIIDYQFEPIVVENLFRVRNQKF